MKSDVDGWASARILEESGPALTAAQALATPASFGPRGSAHGNLGPRANPVWLRTALHVEANDNGIWWLGVGFAGADRADALYQGKNAGRNRVLRGGATARPIAPRARRRAA